MSESWHDIRKQLANEIEQEIKSVLSPRVVSEPNLSGILAYQLGWLDQSLSRSSRSGGKMVRPIICLLACEAAGAEHRIALPAAAALELLHNFTLIHDDVQDESPERRHRPTVWKKWGASQAINAGDAMYTLACLALLRLHGQGVTTHIVVEVMKLIFEAGLSVAEGQYLDLCLEEVEHVSVDEYLAMARRKTASLMACSARVGALLGVADRADVESYARFGASIGLCFQMVDDVIGIWGDGAVTGKPVGEDILRGKKSLPIVFGLHQGEKALKEIYRQHVLTADDARNVVAILDRLGAREYVLALAREYGAQALEALRATGPTNRGKEQLRELARFLIERQY